MTVKSRIKSAIDPRLARQLRRNLPALAPDLQRFGLYWPRDPGAPACSRPVTQAMPAGSPQPVPPRELWAGYGTTAESYLASGAEDCETMRRLLADSGALIEDADRILDLGCAAGRMIRHLADLTPRIQVWGCDIWADAISWCQGALSPPFWFATTTVFPHLPFEDRSFGLIYCGSLFTHIDDLAEAWLLELHRILRPGGRLYFSVNDRDAVDVFDGNGSPGEYARYYERTGGRELWDAYIAGCEALPDYERFRGGDAWMAALDRNGIPDVLWDAETLCERVAYGYRRCSVTPQAYGHQTGIVLERI